MTINLQQIRKQYPQYSDLSDQELADALHSKFYSDMPKSEFYSKIGYSEPGFLRNIAQGIAQSITQKPEQLTKGSLIPGEKTAAVMQATANPFKEITSQPYQAQNPNSVGGAIGRNVLPFAAAFYPGVGAEEATGALLSKLPEFTGSGLVKSALSGAAGGAASAPIMGQSTQSGALGGAVLGPLGHYVMKAPSALSALIGKMPLEQAKSAFAQVPDSLKLPIGDVLQSPTMQRIQKSLGAIPFSGAYSHLDEVNNAIKNGLENLTSDAPQNIPNKNSHVYDEYAKAYENAKQNTDNKYNLLADAADKVSDQKFDKSKLLKAIADARSEIAPKLSGGSQAAKKLYKPVTDLLDDYEKASIPNFGAARGETEVLNDMLRQNVNPEDSLQRRYIGKVKQGLLDSIEDNAQNNPELSDLFNQAKDARKYQGTFEKFNGKDTPFNKIYNNPMVSDKGQFIANYVKPSKGSKDNSALLESLTSKLSPENKQVVGEHYLNPNENLSLSQQLNNLKSLNDRQREILFQDKKPLSDQILHLKSIVPESQSPGFVAKTGLTGAKGLQLGAMLLHPYLAGVPVAARGLTELLKSNALRNAYLKSLQYQPRDLSPATSTLLRNLVTSNLSKSQENK